MREKYTTVWSDKSIRHIHNADPQVKNHFLYVQEAGDFQTFPGYYTERENLPSYLILYTLGGVGNLEYEGKNILLKPGTAVCLDCMKHHIYQTGKRWDFLWIHIGGNTAGDYAHLINEEGLKVCGGGKELEDKMRQVLELSLEGSAAADLRAASILTSILTDLLLDGGSGRQSGGEMPEIIRQVRHYLDQHYLEEINLEDLSGQFGLSRSYLCRRFRTFTGFTILNYCQKLRTAYAKELLRTTDLPVSRIAETCGHPHVSHFIEGFRRTEGVTPLVYRRMWSGDRNGKKFT